jgi:iron complex outermembrane receptor protein
MKTKITLFLTTALAGGLLASPVLAQSKPDTTKSTSVTEVVVTATRRAQKVLDVPYNISAVSGKSIDADHVQNAAELLRSVPGVAIVDRGPRNQGSATNIQMRGVNVDSSAVGDYWLPTVAPVSTYVNDTPLFANFELLDLARVEVLRGPQGTLYGSGSLGGTVRCIYNQPQFDRFSGRIGLTGTQVDGSGGAGGEGEAVVNIPITSTVAVRLSGEVQDYPGVVDYVNLYKLDSSGVPVLPPGGVFSSAGVYDKKKDADTTKIQYGRASIRWAPTDRIDLNFTFAGQHDDIGGRRQVTTGTNGYGVPYGAYQNGAVLLEPSKRDVTLEALEATIDFGFATLTSSTSHYEHTGSSVTDNSGFYANDTAFHNFYYNYTRPAVPAYRSYSDEGTIEEVRLVSKTGGALDWVVGAFAERNLDHQSQDDYVLGFQRYINAYFGLPANSTLVASSDHQFLYRASQSITDLAAFGELTWHVTDKFQVTGGLRHFHTDQSTDILIDFPVYTFVSDPDHPPTIKQPNEKTLFKFNASYKFDERALAYATVSQGYRHGGTNEVTALGRWAEDPRWRTYKPDSVVNYEAGVKGQTLGISYSAALYYIDWTDIQLNTFTDNYGFFAVANGRTARSEGFEGSIEGRLSPQLHYSVGYTFTDAKLTSNLLSPTGLLLAANGERLPGTPQHAVTVAADYTVPLSNSSLIFGVSGYYQSTVRNALGESTPLHPSQYTADEPGFQLWNLKATWLLKTWDATLFVKNVFNDPGVTGEFTQAYMGTNPTTANYYGNDARKFISLPRTVGLALNYHW